ncbi:thermonuclease family protein [Thalassospira sp. MA62]|nr:thermonuclease family protein [Thalassospira sp. MA62]
MIRNARLLAFLVIPALSVLGIGLILPSHDAKATGSAAHQSDDNILFDTNGRDVLVIDGDTIMIDGNVLDIAGIDAPELGQQCLHNDSFWDCGMSAAMQLRKYFAMAPFDVQCWAGDSERSPDNGDIPIVECEIGKRDIAAAMISDGEALPIPEYSHRYDSLSTEADNGGLGIHGGTIVLPADWRDGKRLDGETGRCLFSADDNGTYVSSIDPRFDELDLEDNAKFCSNEEARNKGLHYRPTTQ